MSQLRTDGGNFVPMAPGSELLLGWSARRSRQIGFTQSVTASRTPTSDATRELISYQGDAHLITVAPTGTGKTTGLMVPNLLHYEGSVVVVDVKGGELTHITARRRREMGQEVVVLDPFGVTGEETAGLSPLEVFSLPGSDCESNSEWLSALFGRDNYGVKDPFWDQNGQALLSAVIAMVASQPAEDRKLSKVFDNLLADDTVYQLAVVLDTVGKTMPKMAHREIAAFLQMPDVTRGGVLATTLSYLKTLHSPRVLNTLDETTFSIPDFISGKPMSIYLVLPVDKLQSHRAILKLWIGTLLKAIVSRTYRPKHRTLLMIDECGQLGNFPFLETFITLCRGFSCSAWLCFQDLAQLQAHYPIAWKTLLNNMGVISTFGFTNRDLATQWSNYLDTNADQLRAFGPHEAVVSISGQGEQKIERMNYLLDQEFAGQYDPNPMYELAQEAAPMPNSAGQSPPGSEGTPPKKRKSRGSGGNHTPGLRQL